MRISDWSSDVCSSDLVELRQAAPPCWEKHRTPPGCTGRVAFFYVPDNPLAKIQRIGFANDSPPHMVNHISAPWESPARQRHTADRKRAVTGKSMTVRVELGGRSIITKKKETSI